MGKKKILGVSGIALELNTLYVYSLWSTPYHATQSQ